MTKIPDTDILIVGCGPAGLAAAVIFTEMGLEVNCIERLHKDSFFKSLSDDNRSTAILMPGINILSEVGIWDKINQYSAPLKIMRLADAGGERGKIRYIADFDAKEVSQDQFGFNIPNYLLKKKFIEHLLESKNFSIQYGKNISKVVTRSKSANILFDDSSKISAKLIIGADGRDSFLRQIYNIKKKKWSYNQKALAFIVIHEMPHNDVSTEIHKNGGPFTLVPLPYNGVNKSAVIWMDKSEIINNLVDMTEREFEHELQKRSLNVLGKIKLEGTKTSWPIISQYAKRIYGDRLALIAEAAHVFPPIGAQGLNTSFGDLRSLSNIVKQCIEKNEDYGLEINLAKYNKERWSEIYFKILGIDALNRAALFENKILKDLRLQSLKLIHNTAALRNIAISSGLGY